MNLNVVPDGPGAGENGGADTSFLDFRLRGLSSRSGFGVPEARDHRRRAIACRSNVLKGAAYCPRLSYTCANSL